MLLTNIAWGINFKALIRHDLDSSHDQKAWCHQGARLAQCIKSHKQARSKSTLQSGKTD